MPGWESLIAIFCDSNRPLVLYNLTHRGPILGSMLSTNVAIVVRDAIRFGNKILEFIIV